MPVGLWPNVNMNVRMVSTLHLGLHSFVRFLEYFIYCTKYVPVQVIALLYQSPWDRYEIQRVLLLLQVLLCLPCLDTLLLRRWKSFFLLYFSY